MALSLPPWGWWPLGVVGAALAYWRLGSLRARSRAWSGWLVGLGCFTIGLAWARAFNWYGALSLVCVEALFMSAAAVATPPRRGRALGFVGAWTLAEALRWRWPFGGLPLGGVALGQADGPLVQLARLGGPLLVTAAVWGCGVALATFTAFVGSRLADKTLPLDHAGASPASPRRRAAVGRSPRLGGAIAVTLGVVGLSVLGAVSPDGGAPTRTIQVALVQGGGQRGVSKEDVDPRSVYDAQLAASGALDGGLALVLWPEDVVSLERPLSGSTQAAQLARLARLLHTTLVVGTTEPASPTSFRNTIVAWGPRGHVVGVFEKVHRVPFGEYVPFRSLVSHLADVSGVPTDAIAGHGSGLMRTPAGPLGLLVSFEVFFPDRSRASVRAGAQLLAVPTNTTSYSTSQVPSQELAAARMQAVQTGRNLIQAAPTGYSAVVTRRGVVLQRSALGRRQVLLASVPLLSGFTPYDHWGDAPVLILSAAAVVLGWTRHWRGDREVDYS
jgi:apolipoprotein N-acyltransferase